MKPYFYTAMMLLLAVPSLCVAATHEQLIANAPSKIAVEPIDIGGARYKLSISDFKRTVIPFPPGPPPIQRNIYKASIPVYGDFSQNLFFDVFGVSGRDYLYIKTSCGTYNDIDLGPKYVMSKIVRTNGSCQTLNVEFTQISGRGINPTINLNLNVLISEQLD